MIPSPLRVNFAAMRTALQTLIRICLLAAKPQDLPASREFLVGCIAAAFSVQFVGYNMLTENGNPFLLAASNTALLGVGWIILLQITRRMERWHQSACAIYGSTAIINLASLPIIAWSLDLTGVESGGLSDSARLIVIGLWAWEIAVSARIIRETLEIRMPLAVAIGIALSFALQVAMVFLFGPAG